MNLGEVFKPDRIKALFFRMRPRSNSPKGDPSPVVEPAAQAIPKTPTPDEPDEFQQRQAASFLAMLQDMKAHDAGVVDGGVRLIPSVRLQSMEEQQEEKR